MTGAELAAYRQRLGLSLGALARALGVPTSTVSRWERGLMVIRRPEMLRLALERLLRKR
jgi:DNA-binding transcriptional regulator YiaG